jgi:hypothetical protein
LQNNPNHENAEKNKNFHWFSSSSFRFHRSCLSLIH